jgi:hypothetical protein
MKYGVLIIAVVLTLVTILYLESLPHPLRPELAGVVFVLWLGVVKGFAVVIGRRKKRQAPEKNLNEAKHRYSPPSRK